MILKDEPGEPRPLTFEWLAAVLDNLSAVIAVRDAEGRHLLANKSCAEIVGCSPKEVIGKSLYDFMARDEADAIYADDREVLRSGKPMRFEETVTLPSGVRTYLADKTPLYNGADQPAICCVVTDITEMKEREQQERAVQRLEANRELAVRIAQDFNNLLQITLGAAGYLKKVWPDDQPPPEIDDILDASRRGAQVVRELLHSFRPAP